MSTDKLQEKIAYFEQQELADISDDENEVRDEAFLKMGRELADLQAMPAPPKFARHPSSFLGPTPKEQQRAFEAAAAKRPPSRPGMSGLKRSATAPDVDVTNPVTKRRRSPDHQDLLKRTTSLPDIKAQDDTPFYIWVGEVPREMKKKNAKPADNIKLEPEAKQILRGKIVYFYPNDDISMARRLRIHKCIQLGAAWTRTFRADISHVMFDEGNHSYAQFLRHINKAGISVSTPYRSLETHTFDTGS
jgi:DNA polymerase IV